MFATLRTLFRASAAEAEEAIIDANGPALLGQHLRDARADVERARRTVAILIAREKAEARRIEDLTGEIAGREDQARAALAADNRGLAEDIADHIAGLEDARERASRDRTALESRIAELRNSLAQAERRIAALAAELRAARAGQLCRAAATAARTGLAPNNLERAEAMAERVRETGMILDDQLAACRTIARDTGADLDDRALEAGLADRNGTRRAAILDRLNTTPSKGDDT